MMDFTISVYGAHKLVPEEGRTVEKIMRAAAGLGFDGMYYALKMDGLDGILPMAKSTASNKAGVPLVHSGSANVLMVDGHVKSMRSGDFAYLTGQPNASNGVALWTRINYYIF